MACHADSERADGTRSGESDPLGYLSPVHDLLGCRPRACGSASPEASAFCDRSVRSGLLARRGLRFYSRDECFGRFGTLEADGRAYALTHVSEAEGRDAR